MSVLENSLTSQRDSPSRVIRHSLNLDLEQLGVKFDHDELSGSKPDTQQQEPQSNSIISPNENNNNRLQNEPELELDNKNDQSIDGAPEIPQQDNESPKTITLIEDELISKSSLNASSKFSQYSMEVDNQSFATFLSIKDTSYDTVVKSFQLLFENVSNLFGQRVKHISQTYLSFIRIKYNQQKAYSAVNLGHIQNSKNHIIYINCKTIAQKIRSNVDAQKTKKKLYVKSLQQIKNKLEKHIQTANSEARQKRSKIKQIHSKIIEIGNQMNDLMIAQNRKAKKNSINPQIYSNSFIRTKYLMGKQKAYLSLIGNFLQKILNFVSFISLDLQPKNCLAVKQSMLSFVQAQCSINPQVRQSLTAKIQILSKTNCYGQIYKQVSKMLQLCVPQSISPHNFHIQAKQYGQKQLKKIIQGLISESQTLVYIPVIQLQNKDYAYHSKNKANVRWIRVNHDQKYVSQTIQQLQTYIILTHQGHLVLQLLTDDNKGEEKMAILKLNQIKISRKNNQLILTDKGKGMLGYLFATNAVLASLVFEPLPVSGNGAIQATQNSLIQQFIERVKDVLQQKKQKKAEKTQKKTAVK